MMLKCFNWLIFYFVSLIFIIIPSPQRKNEYKFIIHRYLAERGNAKSDAKTSNDKDPLKKEDEVSIDDVQSRFGDDYMMTMENTTDLTKANPRLIIRDVIEKVFLSEIEDCAHDLNIYVENVEYHLGKELTNIRSLYRNEYKSIAYQILFLSRHFNRDVKERIDRLAKVMNKDIFLDKNFVEKYFLNFSVDIGFTLDPFLSGIIFFFTKKKENIKNVTKLVKKFYRLQKKYAIDLSKRVPTENVYTSSGPWIYLDNDQNGQNRGYIPNIENGANTINELMKEFYELLHTSEMSETKVYYPIKITELENIENASKEILNDLVSFESKQINRLIKHLNRAIAGEFKGVLALFMQILRTTKTKLTHEQYAVLMDPEDQGKERDLLKALYAINKTDLAYIDRSLLFFKEYLKKHYNVNLSYKDISDSIKELTRSVNYTNIMIGLNSVISSMYYTRRFKEFYNFVQYTKAKITKPSKLKQLLSNDTLPTGEICVSAKKMEKIQEKYEPIHETYVERLHFDKQRKNLQYAHERIIVLKKELAIYKNMISYVIEKAVLLKEHYQGIQSTEKRKIESTVAFTCILLGIFHIHI